MVHSSGCQCVLSSTLWPSLRLGPPGFAYSSSSIILIIKHQSCFATASAFTMGKSDENQTQKRAHKASVGESKHKAAAGESKHKNIPIFDALGSNPFETTFEDNDGGFRHSRWRDLFRQLCEFKVQFGHCLVPKLYSVNPKLGQWVSKQRTRYRKNTEDISTSVTAEHIRALECIGFDWGSSKTDWSVRFQQLSEFKVQFGHCLVPARYSTNPKLGHWVSMQRSNYKLYQEGKPTSMTAEYVRALNSIGFDWGSHKTDWSVRFQQLREFKLNFGHCLVPKQYSANPKLGKWVSKQRTRYRKNTVENMPVEHIQALDGLGFEWEPKDVSWNEQFEQLCAYRVKFGHCLVPKRYPANPKLGMWVWTQRKHYRLYQTGKTSPMTVERILGLQSIGFLWDTATFWSEPSVA